MDHIALAALMKVKNIKPDDIGAAPDGYGLGKTECNSGSKWNSIVRNGFFSASGQSPDDNRWTGLNITPFSGVCFQLAFSSANGQLTEAKRLKSGGVWSEWEYVNPPMLPGVEYRTTERWKGKAVYTKLIDLPIPDDYTASGTIYLTEIASKVETIVNAEYREVQGYYHYFNNRNIDIGIEDGNLFFLCS